MNSSELRSFFYGTLLGDSSIHDGILTCGQISKDLIEFKKKIIVGHLPDAKCSIYIHPEYIDKNQVRHKERYFLKVYSCEYIKKLEKIFYLNGKKICQPGVITKLSALGFAMWYADAGSTTLVGYNSLTTGAKSRRITLCTDNFSKEEHETVIIPELEKLGLSIKLINCYRNNVLNNEPQYRLSFRDMKLNQKFILAISSYFYNYFPSLLYKMDFGYRGQTLDNTRYVLPEYKDFYTKMSAHPLFVDRMVGRNSPDSNTLSVP